MGTNEEKNDRDYRSIKLPKGSIPPKKQAVKRHYGSHQFFTKRAWNVVQAYIQNFTQPGDLVLDPFGGSGVTAIEAIILDRRAIHLDLSPLSVFLADAVASSPTDINHLTSEFGEIKRDCEPKLGRWAEMPDSELERVSLDWWYPKDHRLPSNADREYVHELFTRRQILSLSYLLHRIKRIENKNTRKLLLYNFAATVYKCNLTFLSAEGRKESRGGSSIFSIYRYKVAKTPVELDVWEQFELRFKKLLACKKETNAAIGDGFRKKGAFRTIKGSATELLRHIRPRSVDYIFTDPPYGAHIAYLDLSAIWNAWLGFKVSKQDYKKEIIEGGDQRKTAQDYFDLLDESFDQMFKVLKYDRWLSVVFAHKDPAYWDAVVKAAVRHGFQYVGTNVQPLNVVWSMHKKKNWLTVMSGELILNFVKVKDPVTIAISDVGSDAIDIIRNVAELTIVRRDGASTDDIYHELIPKLLESGLLGEVKKNISDITPILGQQFDYDDTQKIWVIRPDTKLGSAIPLENRIRFYVLDYMRRCERQSLPVTFDGILQSVLPNLVNGEQPTKSSILNELKKVAVPADKMHWHLSKAITNQVELSLSFPDDRVLPPVRSPASELSHDEIIVLLCRMAKHANLQPAVGKRELTSGAEKQLLTGMHVDSELAGASEHQRKRVQQIDCIWHARGKELAAFEVETSTAITSGLDRFASLLEINPQIAGDLVLVVPGRRRRKLNDVLFRSHYVGHPLYLENKVKYLFIEDLLIVYESFAKRSSLDTQVGLRLLRSYSKDPETLR